MATIEPKPSPEPGSIACKPPLLSSSKDETMAYKENTSDRLIPLSFNFRGATLADCEAALESSSKAFKTWSQTSPPERRRLLQSLAQRLRAREGEILALIQEEIKCSELWARINLEASVGLIEEAAALVTSPEMRGSIPYTDLDDSYAFVFSRPFGVVLGIAPWNSPLVLGFRAIIAPIAAGNTVIFKDSELSPRIHTLIPQLFNEAGFPPGMVNLILHKPEDAPEIVAALIAHPSVRKVNFTGSTAVGRVVAQKAGQALKPVLLELGGKNCSVVLADADVRAAAKDILQGSSLNGGQICMSTDLAIVVQERVDKFKEALKAELEHDNATHRLIMPSSYTKLDSLISDAASHGATIHQAESAPSGGYPVTVIENVDPTMAFFGTESFGPVIGIVTADNAEHAVKLANSSDYGLSAAIWTRNHHAALKMAQALNAGAVHINASTVHDEATLPQGGTGSSGFGRFGASWGLQEFVETQTVTLHP